MIIQETKENETLKNISLFLLQLFYKHQETPFFKNTHTHKDEIAEISPLPIISMFRKSKLYLLSREKFILAQHQGFELRFQNIEHNQKALQKTGLQS